MVYNLCSERSYSAKPFGGRVKWFPTDDHNVPQLTDLVKFAVTAARLSSMTTSEGFAHAIHCKGGKGRTGTFVACWLVYSGFCRTANEALEWFKQKRTAVGSKKFQGVAQPSQQRYVRYFAQAVKEGKVTELPLQLVSISMPVAPVMSGGCELWFLVEQGGRLLFDSSKFGTPVAVHKGQKNIIFQCDSLLIAGDIRISFFTKTKLGKRKQLLFTWFHTGMLDSMQLVLQKQDLECAWCDSKNRVFSDDFRLVVAMAPPERRSTCAETPVPTAPADVVAAGQRMRKTTPTEGLLRPTTGSAAAKVRSLHAAAGAHAADLAEAKRRLSVQLGETHVEGVALC